MNTDRPGLAAALQQLGRDRNPTAWAHIVACCAPASERLARRLAGNADVAHDAVQEAWLQIRDGAKRFAPRGVDPDAGAWGWIMRVTANATLMWKRRHRRRALPLHAESEPIAPEPPEHDRDLSDALRRALAELPEDQRTAVVLHHLSGLDFIAVGAASGCSAATAKMRAHRAIERLRKQLRPAGAALTVLAVTSALSSLPAAEGASTVPLASLLTSGAKAQLATASVIGGMTMTMKMMLLALALSAVSGGLTIAQEKQAPPPPQTVAAIAAIEVIPIDIEVPDPAWIQELTKVPTGRKGERFNPRMERDHSWQNILTNGVFVSQPGTGYAFQPFMSAHVWETETVAPDWDWKRIFDAFASLTKTTWRIRGSHIDCIPLALATRLQHTVDGGTLPIQNRSDWLEWMRESRAMRVFVEPPLIAAGFLESASTYRIRPGQTTVEAVIQGLSKAWGVSAYLMPSEQTLLIAARPAKRTIKPPVEIQPSYVVYNGPQQAVTDWELTFDFKDMGMAQVVEQFSGIAGVPIELDDQAKRANPITLKADRMKLKHALGYLAMLTGTTVIYLDDRIRLEGGAVQDQPAIAPNPEPGVISPPRGTF